MATTDTILIVEDDPDVAYAAEIVLRRKYGRVHAIETPSTLGEALTRWSPDVVLLDMNFTPGQQDGSEGLQLLERLTAAPDAPAVVVVTGHAQVPLAVKSLKCGASDFLVKPWDNHHLQAAVESALAQRRARHGSVPRIGSLIGQSRAMREVASLIARVGPTGANVMILGEHGVGKELVARALHAASSRAAGPFIAADLGALPETTFESELFGHVKGAYTDARTDRAGRFVAADGGSIFLDEIGNISLTAQAKLLTVLERRQVAAVGSDLPRPVDVRVISATNVDETGLFDPLRFRQDLLFRLNTIVIRVPPLRERRDDIPSLLRHYLTCNEQRYGRPGKAIGDAALAKLTSHMWPGNVRSLCHACERAVILSTEADYQFDDFGLPAASPPSAGSESSTLSSVERETVRAAIVAAEGNLAQAARTLGISRTAIYRKIKKYGL